VSINEKRIEESNTDFITSLIKQTEQPKSDPIIDIKTYAMAMLKKDYRKSVMRSMPKHWFDQLPHTHIALDDAIEQAALFCNMLLDNLET